MVDEFDQELDRGPEGSIITPIFMGCSAMGLGCLFSVGAIAIGVMFFLPGIWNLISEFDSEPLLQETLTMVTEHPEVIAAVGQPMEVEFEGSDADAVEDSAEVTLGDDIEFTSNYVVTGPNGRVLVQAIGTHAIAAAAEWNVTSVIATLPDGRQVRIFPGETDTPPPPQQLAPPETEPIEGAEATGETPLGIEASATPEELPAEDEPEADGGEVPEAGMSDQQETNKE